MGLSIFVMKLLSLLATPSPLVCVCTGGGLNNHLICSFVFIWLNLLSHTLFPRPHALQQDNGYR